MLVGGWSGQDRAMNYLPSMVRILIKSGLLLKSFENSVVWTTLTAVAAAAALLLAEGGALFLSLRSLI